MRTLNLQLVGTTPLLLHKISRHQLREQIASKGGGVSIEDEVREVMVKDEHGNPAVPVSWLWDAIRVGCSRITIQGQQVSFARLQSIIRIPEGLISLRDTDNRIPTRETYSSLQHAGPRSSKSITVIAPMFKDWMLSVQISISANLIPNDSVSSDKLLDRILAGAGRAGIGLFHPPKKHFGQFRVFLSG